MNRSLSGKTVRFLKGPLEERLRDFESNEIVIGLVGVLSASHFDHIETEFGFQMIGRIIFVGHFRSELGAQLGIDHGHRSVHRHWMADIVGRIVRERAQSEGIVIEILRLFGILQQCENEVTAAGIVHQIAEEMAAERIVAHVLDNGAAVGIGVGLTQLVVSGVGEALEKERAQDLRPGRIDNGFVSEDRIRGSRRRPNSQN